MGNAINLNGSKGIRYKLNEEVATGDTWVDGKPIFAKGNTYSRWAIT